MSKILFLLTILVTPSVFGAEISYESAKKVMGGFQAPVVRIKGEILDADVQEFADQLQGALNSYEVIIKNANWKPDIFLTVSLDSTGGSVYAAIEIGRKIREAGASVYVGKSATCASACLFALAGGASRSVAGKVGIHRPYLLHDPSTTADAQKKVQQELANSIKSYFEEVNVPLSLYDAMVRVPPHKIRYLTESEMQLFNLNEDDPYIKDAETAKAAQSLNMTTIEYTGPISKIGFC